jgi:hypothetical protein
MPQSQSTLTRMEEARSEHVAPDLPVFQKMRERLAEVDAGGLAERIRHAEHLVVEPERAAAGDGDHLACRLAGAGAAAVARVEQAEEEDGGVVLGGHVELERSRELVPRAGLQQRRLERADVRRARGARELGQDVVRHAGVVDEQVDVPVPGLDRVDDALDGGLVEDVAGECDHVAVFLSLPGSVSVSGFCLDVEVWGFDEWEGNDAYAVLFGCCF